MDKTKILELCKQKKSGEILISWDELAIQCGYVSGEALRCFYKKWKKSNDIPTIIRHTAKVVDKFDEQKELIKLRDQRRELNKVVAQNARFEYFKDEIKSIFQEENKTKPIIINQQFIKSQKDNEALCLWGDWHYAMFCDNHWNQYDTDVFKQRLTTLVQETIKIGKEHDVNKIHVMCLGDLVSGILHTSVRVASMEDIIQQTKDVSQYLVESIKVIANNFEEVHFYSVIGNHGRVLQSKQESLEAENFERLIPWYIEGRFEGIKNVVIHDNEKDKTVIIANVKGKTVYGVHGDLDRVSNAVQNLSLMFKEIPYMVCMGHLHHHQEDSVQDVKVVMTGSLVGTDEYAKNIRKVGSPSQAMVIFDENGKRCVYEISL